MDHDDSGPLIGPKLPPEFEVNISKNFNSFLFIHLSLEKN